MMKSTFIEKLQGGLTDDSILEFYIVVTHSKGYKVKKADLDFEKTNSEMKKMFQTRLEEDYINNEELAVLDISSYDERSSVIYKYDLVEVPEEIKFFDEFDHTNVYETFSLSTDTYESIKGFIIYIGTHERGIALYKQQYPIFLMKTNSFLLYKSKERFVKMDKDLLRITDSFQFLKMDEEIFIADLKVLEKYYGFDAIIRKEAAKAIDLIGESGILESMDVLRESAEEIAFARKLTKVKKDSPVLNKKIPADKIIKFTQSTNALKDMFKYNEDNTKIRLDTKKSRQAFVRLLNDDFLRSELTDMYYSSGAKDRL